ncbi:MAG: HNH endonuclease [Candidatus Scalinduaceae bacterium]
MGSLPQAKRYEIAAEFGFRCAICRAPVWEIHHIVEQEHGGTDNRTNLIPLCPNHHQAYYHREKLIKKPELINLRENPIGLNDCEGLFVGPLSNQKTILIGNCEFIDCHPIFSYENIPIIDIMCGNAYQSHLYLYCEDRNGQPVVQIQNGEWVVGKGAFRFENTPTYISIQDDQQPRELLRVSLDQNSHLRLNGCFYIDKHYIEISPDEFRVNRIGVSGSSVKGVPGFRIMKNGRVLF